jgi:hypothetical protein
VVVKSRWWIVWKSVPILLDIPHISQNQSIKNSNGKSEVNIEKAATFIILMGLLVELTIYIYFGLTNWDKLWWRPGCETKRHRAPRAERNGTYKTVLRPTGTPKWHRWYRRPRIFARVLIYFYSVYSSSRFTREFFWIPPLDVHISLTIFLMKY